MKNVTMLFRAMMILAVMTLVSVTEAQTPFKMLQEGFNASTTPTGWTVTTVGGTGGAITYVTSGTYPYCLPYEGSYMVRFNSFSSTNGVMRLSGPRRISNLISNLAVNFYLYHDLGYSGSPDNVQLQYSLDNVTWVTVGQVNRYNGTTGWANHAFTLPAGALGQQKIYIGFLFTSYYGNDCYFDLATMMATPPAPGGSVPGQVTIGTGTNTCVYPYTTFWEDGKTDLLYTAAELTANGGTSGNITALSFNVSTANPYLMNGFKIKVQNTAATSLTSFTNSGWTDVYNGTYTVPAVGWQQITFTTPYNWNGTSNLLFEVCYNNNSYGSYSYVYGTTMGANMAVYQYTDLPTDDGCTYFTTGTPTTIRPNIRLNMMIPPPANNGHIMGVVTSNQGGVPISGATIAFGTNTTTSFADGYYQLLNIPVGTQTINFSAAGYNSASSSVAIVLNTLVTGVDKQLVLLPSFLQGVITNAITNAPILGAKVQVGNTWDYTKPDGSYNFAAFPTGTQTVTVSKPGFITSSATTTITPGGTTTYSVGLLSTANPPGPVTATLNGTSTAVDITWIPPSGLYEIIYDDGGRENWTVWATAGNMNAVKFTPVTGGALVMAGRVNIGDAVNYPAGTDPTLLAPFQMAVYDATGPAGTPGAQVGDLVDVQPANFGWNSFTFPTPVSMTGIFYLVMLQGGVPPAAAGLAVDMTTNKLRSYSHFGTGPWLPASGNYMIRAVVTGQGGPLDIDGMQAKTEITANPIQGLIYEQQPVSVSGYEGEATYQPVDWSSMTNVANVKFPNYTGGKTTGGVATDVDNSGVTYEAATYTAQVADAPMATLFDNGPAFNSTGTGAGGANESIYYQGGTGTYGSGCQYPSGIYVADDFVVPSGKTWGLTSMDFYSYQTNSTTTSTITGIYLRVWNGKPGVAGSTVVWGDMTTNRMASTTFANIYRVLTVNGGVARPVMKVVANTPGLSLASGTYWIEWACTGTLASGPWVPPVVTANNVTGNAIQTTDAGVTYLDVLYNTYAQGFPFVLYGNETTQGGGIPYSVWRLIEGNEANEPSWTQIASNITATNVTDNSWPSLPDGPYRWAVKAGYPVNRLSPPTFSNVIGKNWTAAVTVNVTLTCAATPVAGTLVKLQNTAFSQYVYTATTTSTGIVTFPAVWKGTYDLTVSKIGYDSYLQPGILIMGPMTLDVILLQQKLSPSNMDVNPKSLHAIWNSPVGLSFALNEDWASGSFATNQWTYQANWAVYTFFGNPAPDAEFLWFPTLTNYDRPLTSKTLTGTGSPDQKLLYDIYLSNFSTATTEELSVEIQIGAGPWTLLKNYTNQGGNIAWTTETLDIASVGTGTFQVRFRAHGPNSFNINNWDVDNIKVRSIAPDPRPCILAYYVYLNNAVVGSTPDTTYDIPPSLVQYGNTYTACVRAVYGSGESGSSCDIFTSTFLYPPMNLQVEAVECAAYLTWEKPVAYKKANVPAFTGTIPESDMPASAGLAPPIDRSQIIAEHKDANNSRGSIAFGAEAINYNWVDFDLDNVTGMTPLGADPYGGSDFVNGMVYPVGVSDVAYACTYYSTNLYTIDHGTLAWTSLGSYGSGSMQELTVDKTTGIIYATSGSSLYSIDPAGPTATLIGPHGGGITLMIGCACDGNGDLWAYDIVNDFFYSVDKTTGAATAVGSLGWNANYAQSMFYDQATDQVILGGFNLNNFYCEIRAVDVTTGGSTILSSVYYNEITGATLPVGGGGAVKGLLGYKIYRDGTYIHYIGDPDTLFWYDFTVEPGSHEYGVTAYYDLSEYLTPPPPPMTMFDESMIEGPVEIDIMCGRELPFCETWDQGSFGYNDWTLAPTTTTNWSVTPTQGHPVPAADFSWDPIQYAYEISLESPVMNGGPFTCATVWCDFEYKLVDRNATGAEFLDVDVFYKGSWHNKAEFVNSGNKDWTMMHVDITAAKGKAFKVRFLAKGENSADILHWYVDNICFYAKCNPPIDLTEDVINYTTREVLLTWSAPECGTEGPDPIWIHWDDGQNSTSIGTGGAANFDIAARWDASQIANLDGGSVTKIAFYPASAGSATFSIRVWEGVDAGTMLVDQLVPTVTYDDWNIVDVVSPAPIDISKELWIGCNVNATAGWPAGCDAGPAITGYGDMIYFNGVWDPMSTAYALDYNWNLQAYVEAVDKPVLTGGLPLAQTTNYKSGGTLSGSGLPSLNPAKFNPAGDNTTDGRDLLGYNVYRSDDGKVTYNKVNTNLIPDTTYMDLVPGYQDYWYYVTSVFPTYGSLTCESDKSNEVLVTTVMTGVDPMNGGGISIYPNPATDNVVVKSDFTITSVEVLNYIGQTVYSRQNVSDKSLKVNVANLTAGVYFVKVTTTDGTKTVKITVTR